MAITPLLLPRSVRPNGQVLQGILDLRRTWQRIRLLRRWSSPVGPSSRGDHRQFAAVSHDQARSWGGPRPETWVGVGWRGGGEVPGRPAHRRPACGERLFDLHPLWAVLAFRASIDGLLCLSDPLAKTRHPRFQPHSRTSTRGSPSAPRAPTAARETPMRDVVSLALDRRASRPVVSVIALRG